MLKQKSKLNTWRWSLVILLVGSFLLTGLAQADVAPPKGQVKVKAMYAIKAPKTKLDHTFLLVETSPFDKAMLKIMPFRWGMPFAASGCYRCSANLVALTKAQATKLLGLLENHPAFAKDQKVLKKLDIAGKLQWLGRVSFRSLTDSARTPKAKPMTAAIIKFFKTEKMAKSSGLSAQTTVPSKHKGMVKMVYFTMEGVKKDSIELKSIGQSFKPAASGGKGIYGNRTRRKRRSIALARNPWFYAGMLLLLGIVFIGTRRNRQ